jgi:hypothetical protein
MKRLVESFEEFTSKKNGAKKLNEGTGNFYNRNASKIYAIGLNDGEENEDEYDEDGELISGYSDPSEMIQDEIDNVKYELASEGVFGEKFDTSGFHRDDSIELSDRNHPITEIGELTEYFTIGRNDYRVTILCFATSGYYEGANLDWTVGIVNETGDFVIDYSPTSQEIPLKIKQWISRTTKKIETVYSEFSESMEVFAKFDNGETMYKKA